MRRIILSMSLVIVMGLLALGVRAGDISGLPSHPHLNEAKTRHNNLCYHPSDNLGITECSSEQWTLGYHAARIYNDIEIDRYTGTGVLNAARSNLRRQNELQQAWTRAHSLIESGGRHWDHGHRAADRRNEINGPARCRTVGGQRQCDPNNNLLVHAPIGSAERDRLLSELFYLNNPHCRPYTGNIPGIVHSCSTGG